MDHYNTGFHALQHVILRSYELDHYKIFYLLPTWYQCCSGPSEKSLIIMVALCNRADHYIFILFLMAALCNRGAIIFLPCDFYLLSSSFFFFLA